MEIKGTSPTTPELQEMFNAAVAGRGDEDCRWQDYASWTLPSLYPDLDSYEEQQHDTQSLGAQALNNLSNKIAMTLFAPARPFFKLELSPEMIQGLVEDEGHSLAEIEVMTSETEKQAMRKMEKVRMRTSVIMAMQALIGLGNTLMYFPKDGGKSQVYQLRDYITLRDPSGTVVTLIMRDARIVSTLDEELQAEALLKGRKAEDKVDLFTGVIRLPSGKYSIKQEIEDISVVPTAFGLLDADQLPWIPLTWKLIRGENYGTGLVEEYAGDFSVYSKLSEATLNLASLAADIKILINPLGQTDVDELNDSPSGTYVNGVIDDVAYLQLEKMSDFQFVQTIMDTYAARISAAFLMQSQVTRSAERVTATEIRMNSLELESSLGGVYSRLAEEMQQPIAKRAVALVSNDLAALEPVILTGVESLSRSSEHEQLMMFLEDLTMINNIPESMVGELKLSDMASIMAANRGIEAGKFLKTPAEKQAEQQAAQQAQQAQAQAEGTQKGAAQAAAQPQPTV